MTGQSLHHTFSTIDSADGSPAGTGTAARSDGKPIPTCRGEIILVLKEYLGELITVDAHGVQARLRPPPIPQTAARFRAEYPECAWLDDCRLERYVSVARSSLELKNSIPQQELDQRREYLAGILRIETGATLEQLVLDPRLAMLHPGITRNELRKIRREITQEAATQCAAPKPQAAQPQIEAPPSRLTPAQRDTLIKIVASPMALNLNVPQLGLMVRMEPELRTVSNASVEYYRKTLRKEWTGELFGTTGAVRQNRPRVSYEQTLAAKAIFEMRAGMKLPEFRSRVARSNGIAAPLGFQQLGRLYDRLKAAQLATSGPALLTSGRVAEETGATGGTAETPRNEAARWPAIQPRPESKLPSFEYLSAPLPGASSGTSSGTSLHMSPGASEETRLAELFEEGGYATGMADHDPWFSPLQEPTQASKPDFALPDFF